MKRLLNPATNPNGWTALLAAAYAIVQAVYGHTPADPRVWLPAVVAFLSLLTRQLVTPVKDPRDGNGKPLGPPSMRQVSDAARSYGWDLVRDSLTSTGPAGSTVTYSNVQPSGALPPAVQPPATSTGSGA